jgi:hypothetical protein
VLAAAAAAPGGCLLYTDPINSAPEEVTIVRPASLHAGKAARFTAWARDRDGDAMSFAWSRAERPCAGAGPDDFGGPQAGETLELTPRARQAFCLRLTATDEHGAAADAVTQLFEAENLAPQAGLELVSPAPRADVFPLFTSFRLSAERSRDEDGDELKLEWRVRDGAGTAVAVVGCGTRQICFDAVSSGRYLAEVVVSDGPGQDRRELVLPVAEDRPACLEATEPTIGTETIVLVDERPRRFEVRQVSDDGHPFPPGPRGGPRFYWFTARGSEPWQREPSPVDRASFDVGPALFDDLRPGSRLRVRVEVRDPEHDGAAAAAVLRGECGDRGVCEQPARCARWVSWTVELR